MSTAQPFIALGRGNGFPFCPSRLDVDGFDLWTTLGGYNKDSVGSPTQQQIDDSLRNAMKLWWNSKEMTAYARAESTRPPPLDLKAEVGNLSIDKAPYLRVCDTNIIEENTDTAEDLDAGLSCDATSFFDIGSNRIRRFFLDNEYIGLGIEDSFAMFQSQVVDEVSSPFRDSISEVSLAGTTNLTILDTTNAKRDISYELIDGIPVVSIASAFVTTAGSVNVDASTFSASATVDTSETEAEIVSLGFWEY